MFFSTPYPALVALKIIKNKMFRMNTLIWSINNTLLGQLYCLISFCLFYPCGHHQVRGNNYYYFLKRVFKVSWEFIDVVIIIF